MTFWIFDFGFWIGSQENKRMKQRISSVICKETSIAVAFRYPGEEATKDDSRKAVLAMKGVRDVIRQRLGLP
jgi:hypothetical protein